MLSYLLAFVQLPWQLDNGWFLPVFDNFFVEFINMGPVYIREWVGRAWGWGGWWQRLKQRSKMTQMVEFIVVVTSTCIHKANIPLQGLDRHLLTMGAISGPHCQIRALHWHHLQGRSWT